MPQTGEAVIAALVGAGVGALVTLAATRLNMRHERKLALFRLEVAQIEKLYDLIVSAATTVEAFALAITMSKDTSVIKEYEVAAKEVQQKLISPPLTTSPLLKRRWKEFLQKDSIAIGHIIKIGRGEVPNTEETRNEMMKAVGELKLSVSQMLNLLTDALENFEKGKPTFPEE